MANEELYGTLGGATQGAVTGGQLGGPIGAIGGAVLGGLGGAFSGHSAKKQRRKAEQRLREALQRLMAGSVDAYGNTLSADNSGRWSYNLSNAGKNAKNIAEKALLSAKNVRNLTPQEIADKNALMQALSEINAKKATQSAVARVGLRTGSNLGNSLGNIARQSTQALRNNILQGRNNASNSQLYNANIKNNLNNTATNAMVPLNSMQSNLQQMVRGLNMPTYQASLGVANGLNSINYPDTTFNQQTLSDIGSLLGNLIRNGKK